MPLYAEVPIVLALLALVAGIAAIPLDWVKLTIDESNYDNFAAGTIFNTPPSTSLFSEGFDEVYGATPIDGLLVTSAVFQLLAFGTALYASRKPNLRRMKDVCECEAFAVLCLVAAGGIWAAVGTGNLEYIDRAWELNEWKYVVLNNTKWRPVEVSISLFSTGELAGLASLLLSVATGFTAYMVYRTAGTAAPMQVQAWNLSAMGPQAPQQSNLPKSAQAGDVPAMEP